MIHSQDEQPDILERLRHPEREAERRKDQKLLFLRNVLNSVFILLAVIAMVGIVLCESSEGLMKWYILVFVAVIVKMVEVALRMPRWYMLVLVAAVVKMVGVAFRMSGMRRRE